MIACLFMALTSSFARADVAAGDVIDKSNWQKAQGLLLDPVMEIVKKGYLIINVDNLNYDPNGFRHPRVVEALESKRLHGKFDINDKGELIEKETGKFPAVSPIGMPFPDADPKDPNFGLKIAYNQEFQRQVISNVNFEPKITCIGDKYERELLIQYVSFANFANADKVPNPKNFNRQKIFLVKEPFDIQGTSILTWQRNGNVLDSNFVYEPSLRRNRRISPERSDDPVFGTDVSVNDFAVYNGKIECMDWNYIETREMLLPFLGKDPIPCSAQPDGSYITQKGGWEGVKWGYEVKDWKGAPWAPTNWIWQKRKVHLIEMIAKAKGANRGKSIIVVDADTNTFITKQDYNRDGSLRKIIMAAMAVEKSADGKFSMIDPLGGAVVLDLKSYHATVLTGIHPTSTSTFHADNNVNDFTMAGFMKFCK